MSNAAKNTIAVVLILLLVGGIAGAAFYQDEVGGFIRLQGWNTGPITDASKQFIQAAAQNDGQKVAALLAKDSGRLEPESGPNGVRAFKIGDYGGPKRRTLKEMCPSDSPKLSRPRLIFLEGGAAEVEARYPTHKLQMTWDKKPEGWRLISLGWAQ